MASCFARAATAAIEIYGNLVGTDGSGTANTSATKAMASTLGRANNTVGGVAAGLANVIAFNTKAEIGLELLNTDTGNILERGIR